MIGSFLHQASHVHIKIENKDGPPVWNYVRGQGEIDGAKLWVKDSMLYFDLTGAERK